jgi:(1->4)-alpha-D-glucan 1-alpha-D-glucosylmutase
MPGVPDFYQGTEFWDLSLVDPDNRRPVDFAARADALRAVAADPDWSAFTASWQDGRVKLALTRLLLALRTELPDLFTNGAYRPLEVSGPDRDHILAFARSNERDTVFVIIGRHLARAAEGGRWPNSVPWQATVVLGGEQQLRNVLEPQRRSASGPEISVSQLLGPLPVALLHARKVDSRRNRTRIRSAPALAEPATA